MWPSVRLTWPIQLHWGREDTPCVGKTEKKEDYVEITASDGTQMKVLLEPSPVSLIVSHRHKKKHRNNNPSTVGHHDKIQPLNTLDKSSSNDQFELPTGCQWEPHIHPEGKLYFDGKYNFNVYSDAWLYDIDTRIALEAVVEEFEKLIVKHKLEDHKGFLKHIELGIHIVPKEAEADNKTASSLMASLFASSHQEARVMRACYYICNTESKQVFWLHDVDADMFWEDLDHNIVSDQHLRLAAEAAYWEHIYIFPHDRSISTKQLTDLKEYLAFWTFDAGSSKASTSPYTASELKDFAKIVKDIQAESRKPEDACIVGKLMGALLKIRFAYFYGEEHAQVNNSRGVFPHHHDPEHHSFWFRLVNCISFYTAASYYVNLNHLWIGRAMSTSRWNDFVIQLQDDWYDAITPATVILAANLSFLAISSVDNNGYPEEKRSLGQIVSYISLIFNVANIAASTILARQHRSGHHSSFEGEPPKGGPRKKQVHELERLAVIFSIPATFFWWGLLTFFISVGWLCFKHTAPPTRYMSVATMVVSMILLLLIILYTYRDSNRSMWAELLALLPLPGCLTPQSTQSKRQAPSENEKPQRGGELV